jgi:uncharacterized protein with von Willebrand factor type A (vWA) domain
MSETEGTVIQHDQYDTQAYEETLGMYPRLNNTVTDHAERLPTAPALVEDVFYSLYRPSPALLPPEDLALSATVNRSILEEMMNTSEWDAVRNAGTVGDQLYAGMTTATVAKSILTTLDHKIIERLQELHDAEQEAAKLFDQAETLEDLAGQAKGDRAANLFEQAKKARQEGKEQQDQVEELSQELEGDAEEIEDASRRAARTALEQAEAEIAATEDAIKAFTGGYSDTGGTSGGKGGQGTLSLKEKMSLAAKVGKSDKLKQVAELCGRMTRIALATQKSRIKHPPDEIIGITIGDNLAQVVPSELGYLADEDLEDLFYQKFLEKRLQVLDMVGSEKQGRGPIIVALDSSNSMTETLGTKYSKEAWSKAVTLALLAIARLQKRDMAVIHFAESGKVKVFEFPKGEGKPSEVMANTEFFFNGGTQYDTWMQQALNLIEQSKYDRADTIIVSDGQVLISASLEADWNRRRAARGMRCYGVLLGAANYARVLSRVCDAIATVDDLAADNKALDMMFDI